jgi:hypothetical protein
VLGDHRVVGPAIGVVLGELAAGHRDRQLDVIRRVGGDEVDAAGFDLGQQSQGIAESHFEARRVEAALAARVGRADVGQDGATAVSLGGQVPDQ